MKNQTSFMLRKGKLVLKLLAPVFFGGLAIASASSISFADYAEQAVMRQDEKKEVLDTGALLLRKSRDLTRSAKRASEWEVVNKSRSFETDARVLYLEIQQEAPAQRLLSLHEQMLSKLRALERAVEDAEGTSGGRLTDSFEEVERVYFYLGELLGELSNNEFGYVSIEKKTYFKSSTKQSSELDASQKCLLEAGIQVAVKSSGAQFIAGHLQVELGETLPDCLIGEQGNVGFFYKDHVQVED